LTDNFCANFLLLHSQLSQHLNCYANFILHHGIKQHFVEQLVSDNS